MQPEKLSSVTQSLWGSGWGRGFVATSFGGIGQIRLTLLKRDSSTSYTSDVTQEYLARMLRHTCIVAILPFCRPNPLHFEFSSSSSPHPIFIPLPTPLPTFSPTQV